LDTDLRLYVLPVLKFKKCLNKWSSLLIMFSNSFFVCCFLLDEKLSSVFFGRPIIFKHLSCFRPGTYEHDVSTNRKIKYNGTFGGPQTLITSVKIKCNDFGEKDIVSKE